MDCRRASRKGKSTVNLLNVYGCIRSNAIFLLQRNMASNKNGAVMEETFLSRFDALDVRVRKVLQTCAVLGLSFALSDVTKVHPEMEEFDIENALECAMDEMILVEQVEDDDDVEDDNMSARSGSTRESSEDLESHQKGLDARTSSGGERFFQFSHAMWRKNVLATMLKERKMELHRLIAEAMEKDEVLILEQSDISRLLTLFDHWKSCGEFCKVAPLALAVGARLEEWDLAAQSLELYEDALEMAFDGVHSTDQESKDDEEWVQVKAKPIVLDLILRLHICMGMSHQRLGQDYQSILYFQDAYNIIKSASKMSGMSEALVMPIISSLCVLILEEEASDPQSKAEHLKLVHTFIQEAEEDGDPVHIGRSLALRALYSAKHGDFRGALDAVKRLEASYMIEENCEDMVAEYGRDFAMECSAESVQWLYLMGNHDEAEAQAEKIIGKFIPLLDPSDTDQIIYVVLPIIQVFSLLDRAEDADVLLKKYIINPYHDYASPSSEFWAPLFNPLAYLLEIIIMDDEEQHDHQVLDEMENWVLNVDNYLFEPELERKAHTIMGELCWRLALVKEEDEEAQTNLLLKARELLEPVAFYPHNEIFQKQTAQALLEAL
jgi:BMFP domain-containing protein YqiC